MGNRMRWLEGIPDSVDRTLSRLRETVEVGGAGRAAGHRVAESQIRRRGGAATRIFVALLPPSWSRSFSSPPSSSWRPGKRAHCRGRLPALEPPPPRSVPRLLAGSFPVLPSEGPFISCFSACPASPLPCRLAPALLPWLPCSGQPGWGLACLLGQQWSFLCARLTQRSPTLGGDRPQEDAPSSRPLPSGWLFKGT